MPASCTTAATYTIGSVAPNTITWQVNGVATPEGTYKVTAAGDVTLVATPTSTIDGLDPAWVNPTVLKFPAASLGCELETLAYTGSSSIGTFGLAGGMMFIGLGGLLVARRKFADKKLDSEQ